MAHPGESGGWGSKGKGREGHASSKQRERRGIAYENEGIHELMKVIKKNVSEKAKW